MKFNKIYWVRIHKIFGEEFPCVFFETKKKCQQSFENFNDKKNWEARQVRVQEESK